MDVAEIRQALDAIHDQSLLGHGFSHDLRDYELVVQRHGDQTVDPPFRDHVRYRFRYCIEVDVRTRLAAETWHVSLDDRLTDIETASEIERGVRGQLWMGSQELYPGGRVIEGSERARVWANAIGIDFHEIVIESNEQTITLIVSDFEVTGVDP